MSNFEQRTIISETAHVVNARWICELVSPNDSGAGMLTRAASADGVNITHYISSGAIATALADVLPLLSYAYDEEGVELPEPIIRVANASLLDTYAQELLDPDVYTALDSLYVSEEDPYAAMARLGIAFLPESIQ